MSKTYIAAAISFIALLAKFLNVQLPYSEEQLTNTLIIIVGFGSFIWTLYLRWKKGGITVLGAKDPTGATYLPPNAGDQ